MKRLFTIFTVLFLFISCDLNLYSAKILDVTDDADNRFNLKNESSEPNKMTLIVYMAADNDLESFAIQDLKEMEHANFSNMNVIVLFDRAEKYDQTNGNWTDTRLLRIKHDDTNSNFITSTRLNCPELGLKANENTELDMSSGYVLSNLISFVKNNYESEKYCLVIWGHGTGWRYRNIESRAIAIDDESDSYMTVAEMGNALKSKGISVIGFDTCFGGTIENVYELRDAAEYTVGSPGCTPSTGWDYQSLLEAIDKSDFSSEKIAELMANSSAVSTTIITNRLLSNVFTKLEFFSKSLSDSIISKASRNTVFDQLFSCEGFCYSQYPCDFFIDIYEMAKIYSSSENLELSNNAKNLMNSINSACVTTDSENAKLGIMFISKSSPQIIIPYHSSDYLKSDANDSQCSFIKQNSWWIPTENHNSDSLLDKLFYKNWD